MVIENITHYLIVGEAALDEADFLGEVLDRSGAGLLLDVNNVYVNACNHRGEPDRPAQPSPAALLAALEALPLDRVCQIHLAGHVVEGPRVIDNHGAPVCEPVWSLYRAAIERCGPIPTLIEWDTHIPELEVVLAQADLARADLAEACEATP